MLLSHCEMLPLVQVLLVTCSYQFTKSRNSTQHNRGLQSVETAFLALMKGKNAFPSVAKRYNDCQELAEVESTSRNFWLTSFRSTSMPASALAVAMPDPMRPPPSTAIFLMRRGFRPPSVIPRTCAAASHLQSYDMRKSYNP
jgi:hypothetical protein